MDSANSAKGPRSSSPPTIKNVQTFDIQTLPEGKRLTCLDPRGQEIVSFFKDRPPLFSGALLKNDFVQRDYVFPLPQPKGVILRISIHDPNFFAAFCSAYSSYLGDGYKWKILSKVG